MNTVNKQISSVVRSISTEEKVEEQDQSHLLKEIDNAKSVIGKDWMGAQTSNSIDKDKLKASLATALGKTADAQAEADAQAQRLKKQDQKQSAAAAGTLIKLMASRQKLQQQIREAKDDQMGVMLQNRLEDVEQQISSAKSTAARQEREIHHLHLKQEHDSVRIAEDLAQAKATISSEIDNANKQKRKTITKSLQTMEEELSGAISAAAEENKEIIRLRRESEGQQRFKSVLLNTKRGLKRKMDSLDRKDLSLVNAMKHIDAEIAATEMKQLSRSDEMAASKIALGKALDLLKAKATLKGQLSKANSAKTKARLNKSLQKAGKELQSMTQEELVKLEEASVATEASKLIETKAKLEEKLVTADDSYTRRRLQKALDKVDTKLAITAPQVGNNSEMLKEVVRAQQKAAKQKSAWLKRKAELEKQLAANPGDNDQVGSLEAMLRDVEEKIQNADVSKLDERATAAVTAKLLSTKEELKTKMANTASESEQIKFHKLIRKIDRKLGLNEALQRKRQEKAESKEMLAEVTKANTAEQSKLSEAGMTKAADKMVKALAATASNVPTRTKTDQRVVKFQQQEQQERQLEDKISKEENRIKMLKPKSADARHEMKMELQALNKKLATANDKELGAKDSVAVATLSQELSQQKIDLEIQLARAKTPAAKSVVERHLIELKKRLLSGEGLQTNAKHKLADASKQTQDMEASLVLQKANARKNLMKSKEKAKSLEVAEKGHLSTMMRLKKASLEASENASSASQGWNKLMLRAKSARAASDAANKKLVKLMGADQHKELMVHVAKRKAELGHHLKKLAQAQVKCAEKYPVSVYGKGYARNCPELKKEGLEQAVQSARAAYHKAANAAGVDTGSSLDFTCGDGMHQNENGEECDDGNQKDGDGCDTDCKVEAGWSCTGGSWSHESVCDKCGNGVQQADEECDDGNSNAGDGCSSTCKIEAGYTCTESPGSEDGTPSSVCQTVSEADTETERIMDAIHKTDLKCQSHGKRFVMSKASGDEPNAIEIKPPSTGYPGNAASILGMKGVCIAPPGSAAPPQVFQHSTAQLSSLSGFSTRTIGREATRLTCPTPLESIQHPESGEIGAPYAVCHENKYEVCRSTAGASRKCKFRKAITCAEVCIAPRFCHEKGQGELVYRQHGASHSPSGKACCFENCVTPEEWTEGGERLTPEKWCLPFAHDI
jgi:cysteine-rich repeat protein